jgi:flavorubredoxin
MKILFLAMDKGLHGKSDIILKKKYENISYIPIVGETIRVQYGDSEKDIGEYIVKFVKKDFLHSDDEITIYIESYN